MGQVEAQQRRATVARLAQLREAGALTPEHVRLAAAGHGVDERTVRRWLARADQDRPARRRPGRWRCARCNARSPSR